MRLDDAPLLFLIPIIVILLLILVPLITASKRAKSNSANESPSAKVKSVAKAPASKLTPEDVVNKRFQPTKFRDGYDQDEVDDFLDEVVVELRRMQIEEADLLTAKANGTIPPASTPSLTSEQVANRTFKQTKFGMGYDHDDVDDFMDEVVVTLRKKTEENNKLRSELPRIMEES